MNWGVIIPLVIFILLVFFIGIFMSKRNRGSNQFVSDYYLGGRQLGGFILAMTMVATYGSASSFIGGPGIAYQTGLAWVLLAVIQVVTGYFVLTTLGKKFAIISRKMNAVTLVDFLKTRYESNVVVVLSAISIIVFLFSSLAAQWVGGGRLIQSVIGISYESALTIFAITVLLYVSIGGFRAVVLTDSLQGIVMFLGTVILLVATIHAGGGVGNIMNELVQQNPNLISPYGADQSLTPLYVSSFWILVGVGVVGLPQVAVRAMSYKNSRAMHQAMIIGTVVVGVIMLGMHLTGVFARAVIPGIEVGDSVMPLLAMEVLPAWLAGIVLAAPMAAIMSTVDSILLLVSSAIVKDVYLNYINPNANEKQVRKWSFLSTAFLGIAVFLVAIQPPDLLIWFNLFSFGGLESVFIWPIVLGLYWSKGNKYGAIAGMIVGMTSYILIHTYYPNPFGMHTVVLPIGLSLVSFVVMSLLTQRKTEKLREQLINHYL
ncbi:sodium/pantothenate symporter [Metabacillus iocasae]|uniref:Sodium/pantothenate symporter n=1 Tax=Priestia iocasae TaxID=2291674 RepID=A0ABS2QWH5_9BACI|nr:sodium/pantothenate symporter [Metabacillus iocasae]MBM7703806.1 sodium/pantothenate symporter [Metabacillus iocasae]